MAQKIPTVLIYNIKLNMNLRLRNSVLLLEKLFQLNVNVVMFVEDKSL